jgi:hypothetical protein
VGEVQIYQERRWDAQYSEDKHVHRGRGKFVYSWILDVLKLKNESTYI